jgi:hypothetical protein
VRKDRKKVSENVALKGQKNNCHELEYLVATTALSQVLYLLFVSLTATQVSYSLLCGCASDSFS